MKPLFILLIVFCIAVLVIKLATRKYDFPQSARIAMCAMLCFTAIGHFTFTKGMSLMIPDFIPFKTEVVYLTGILEVVLGVCLLVPGCGTYAGWILIIVFILILPANIKASIDKLDFQKGTFEGNGISYLWFRIPLQLLFIAWIYLSSIKKCNTKRAAELRVE